MKAIEQATICVVDHGLFIPLALCLAKKAKTVYYHSPCESGFPMLAPYAMGDFPPLVRVNDFWKIKSEVDAFVFPDIGFQGEQLELESQGIPVWGSKEGAEIELSRTKFLKLLKSLDLDCVTYKVLTGLSSLRNYLLENENKFVKISRFRGLMETFHHESYESSRPILDRLALKCGPLQEEVPFVVVDPVDSDIEIGADTYCINGAWPETMLDGYEWKDAGFLGCIKPRSEMPEQIQEVLEKFGPVLAEERYVNNFSIEMRSNGKQNYFLDPCCRFPLPATGAQIQAYPNLPEIIYYGAHGELVQPEFQHKFVMECVVKIKNSEKESWGEAEIDPEILNYTRFSCCCFGPKGDVVTFPPSDSRGDEVGWISSGGDTIQEAIELLNERVETLPPNLTADTRVMVDLLQEIQEAEDQGIEFTKDVVPTPEKALVLE